MEGDFEQRKQRLVDLLDHEVRLLTEHSASVAAAATATTTKTTPTQSGQEHLQPDFKDLSPKGSIDEPVVRILQQMNQQVESLLTTSSCSGRVALFSANTFVTYQQVLQTLNEFLERKSLADVTFRLVNT